MKKLAVLALTAMIALPAFALPMTTAAHAATNTTTVYSDGHYAGKDPDAHVRADIQREAPFATY